ncbi:SDR family oxidoreductase, partial [Candidatus Pelagibacter ubique]|nr:SDR family oxidoreductase [Candidatus Pelagibacter ubique]
MKKILIIGGEGYIGQELNSFLQSQKQKFEICVVDSVLYKQLPLKKNKKFSNYSFLKYDLSNNKKNDEILNNVYCVILLSGLVGDPITKKYPLESKKNNETLIKKFINQSFKKKIPRLIFISTCSNYGLRNINNKAKENSILKPLSLYSKSKVSLERFILNKKKGSTVPTILRFATAFGLSPRMRFDLTINEFTKDIFLKKKLDVYDIDTWRPYCHIKDFSRLIYKVINADKNKVNFQVFNAGSTTNNFTKQMIIQRILKYIKTKN